MKKRRKSYIRRHRKRSRPARLLQSVLVSAGMTEAYHAYRVVALAFSVWCKSLTAACVFMAVQCCFKLCPRRPPYWGFFRDGEPRRHESHLDQAVSHSSRAALKPPSVQCCVTSSEIVRTMRHGEPAAGTATLIFTQLLSSD